MGQEFKKIGARFDFRLRAPLNSVLNSVWKCPLRDCCRRCIMLHSARLFGAINDATLQVCMTVSNND